MRVRHRTLRELLSELRRVPAEGGEPRAEECLEALFDPERCPSVQLGEREEAALEAERRRWTHVPPRDDAPDL
jgi:hypothetical protein